MNSIRVTAFARIGRQRRGRDRTLVSSYRLRAFHVWVADPGDRSGVKRPGLLVMWRRTQSGAGWEALVLYGAELRPGEWAVVQEWVAEALLTQA